MRYKLKEHVTDEMLIDCGFKKCGYGVSNNDIYICLETHHDLWLFQKGAISFDDVDRDYNTDITPYIQDLIDLDYVEELK